MTDITLLLSTHFQRDYYVLNAFKPVGVKDFEYARNDIHIIQVVFSLKCFLVLARVYVTNL